MKKFRHGIMVFILVVAFCVIGKTWNVQAAGDMWSEHAASSFAGGEGTKSSPYIISNASQLALMAKYYNDSWSVNDGKYFALSEDIDLSAYWWIPIGTGKIPANLSSSSSDLHFSGYFNGNNHKITGMKIKCTDNVGCYGLFGTIFSGTIENVIVENADISIKTGAAKGYNSNAERNTIYVGTITGQIQGFGDGTPLVSHCEAINTKIDVDANSGVFIGGLTGSLNYGSLQDSFASGDIKVKAGWHLSAGGAMGEAENYISAKRVGFRGSIWGENTAAVDDSGDVSFYPLYYIGGFTGGMGPTEDHEFIDCYAQAQITAVDGECSKYGGFIGELGCLYGTTIFKNLYCNSIVSVVDKAGKVIEQYPDFSKSKIHYTYIDGETQYTSLKNCAYYADNILAVRKTVDENVSVPDWQATVWHDFETDLENYDMNENGDVFKKLGYSGDVWNLADGKCPTLKIENKDEWKIIPCTIPSGKTDTDSGNKNETTSAGTVVNGSDNKDTLVKDESGSWWHMKNGKVDYTETLCKYNGNWWYVQGGKVNFNATTLCKYNGSWWYVQGGKVNFNATTLCKYNGSWWYVQGGRVNFNAITLCKYNGTWWYVKNGKVNFNATTLCKYNGSWWYVQGGKVNFKTTLCKYNGTWWYIKNGRIDFSSTTLCKYSNNWYAVTNGKVAWGYSGKLEYNGRKYNIKNGIVRF